MNFSDKVRMLRKEHGISQEELAGRLDVSRQAVSKWENGQGFPEMETVLRMSDLFGVSLDYLFKDDDPEQRGTTEETSHYVSPESARKYLATKEKRGRKMAIGLAILIMSLSFTMYFPYPLGTALFFSGAALGVGILVMLGFEPKFEGYDQIEERPLSIDQAFLKDLQKEYPLQQRKYGLFIAIGIALFILSLVVSVWANSDDMRYISVLPLFWGTATALITFAGTMMGAFHIIMNNREHVAELRTNNGRNWIYGVGMPLASMVFLALGFIWDAWHPGWLVFPVTSLLCYAYTVWGGAKE
ncbi:MAG: helix-turn-helix transcriptional regulator [Firmicutes bacterium]|nr:helix-turn-helix transcriptional regulator [Bacillota bacterium]